MANSESDNPASPPLSCGPSAPNVELVIQCPSKAIADKVLSLSEGISRQDMTREGWSFKAEGWDFAEIETLWTGEWYWTANVPTPTIWCNL